MTVTRVLQPGAKRLFGAGRHPPRGSGRHRGLPGRSQLESSPVACDGSDHRDDDSGFGANAAYRDTLRDQIHEAKPR